MIRTLFDAHFDRLISRRLLGAVYALTLGLHLLIALVAALASIASGGVGILLGLVGVPAVTLVGALFLRLAFEAVVVYFRTAEDVQAVRTQRETGV